MSDRRASQEGATQGTDPERTRREWIQERGKPVDCPYCASTDTRREAVFGPFHMSETYFCRSCRSPFSRIKWEADSDRALTDRTDG